MLGDFVLSYKDEHVHQCLKCWHKWKIGEYLRSDGKDRVRCPKCNSHQTLTTQVNPTKIVIKEDLLMFTDGEYPKKYCPKTSAEELFGNQGVVIYQNGVKIFISRGWRDKNEGHYVYLCVDGRLWMTTDGEETESMELAVKQCPENARVYIAGLGLGLILLKLAQSKKSKEVLVVERDQRVIDIVEPKIRKWFKVHYPEFNWKVICGDATSEIEKHGKWDWIFFDIWSDADVTHKDEPKPEDIQVKATPFLTEKGKLTIWTMVVKEMRESRVSPELKAKIDHMFDMIKNQQLP